ncbi:MAG: hypothetical protein RBU30_04830 [Polyangia bacterium]|jgi:hypothetical protein|nr:hypothetical protein [Polyangia bacterium]
MNGNEFMIERNLRLIGHQARMDRERAGTGSRAGAERAEAELRQEILSLYKGLEGCGRAGAPDKTGPP